MNKKSIGNVLWLILSFLLPLSFLFWVYAVPFSWGSVLQRSDYSGAISLNVTAIFITAILFQCYFTIAIFHIKHLYNSKTGCWLLLAIGVVFFLWMVYCPQFSWGLFLRGGWTIYPPLSAMSQTQNIENYISALLFLLRAQWSINTFIVLLSTVCTYKLVRLTRAQ